MPVRNRLLTAAALAATLTLSLATFAAAQPAGAPQIGPWGFDLSGVDPKAKPGDSFHDYANGAWDARTAIPPDRSRFGMFDALRDKTEEQLRALVEEAAKDATRSGASPSTDIGKIGGLYNAFMDVTKIDALDTRPDRR